MKVSAVIYGDIQYDELIEIVLFLEQELVDVSYDPMDN